MKISLPQIITNVKNAVHGFKKLHGRAFEDPYIQAERAKLPYELQKMPNGSVGVKVSESFGWNLSRGRDEHFGPLSLNFLWSLAFFFSKSEIWKCENLENC